MIIYSIRRRPGLFGLATFLVVLLAGVIVIMRHHRYTSDAEVVVDAGLPATDAEAALANMRAWLRSGEAARHVAASLSPSVASRLIAPDAAWAWPGRRPAGDAGVPTESRGREAVLAQRLRAGLSVTRVADSYSVVIGFTAPDPRLAAAAADSFAAQAVTGPPGGYPAGATLQVISAADPDVPAGGTSPWLVLATGLLVGIVTGAITVAMVERRFTGLTSGADVRSRLGLYHLGSVPLLHSVLPDAVSPIDAVVDAPYSGYAEAFRAIRVAARQASRKEAKVFLVTSALPNEGKSTTVACLARSAALAGEAVVIVDGDDRLSGASAALAGDRRRPGLADLLRGDCALDDALVQDVRSGAWIIPIADDGTDISLLVSGDAFARLLDMLRARFDRVFIDSPPVLAMAATRSMMPLVDASIMVVRWRATADRAVRSALATAPADYALWAGIVLTQVDLRAQAHYAPDDASAFYRQSSKYYR